jgi:VanZ family protein
LTNAYPTEATTRRRALLLTGVYLLFVIYGSLVPLNFTPRPLEPTWRDFLGVSYRVLGIEERADWVANILLYIPLAYLLCAAFASGARSVAGRMIRICIVFVTCAAIALTVEFVQLFFPPRTVSLNDIVAEFIGSGIGIAIWLFWGDALQRLWLEMMRGGLPAIRAAIAAYVLAYLALSLFPYDFLVSAQEFSAKLRGGGYGLMFASGACDRMSICGGKLFLEMVAVVPLGVLLSMALGKTRRGAYTTAALCGLALGLSIEALQFTIASGISQGISVVTRGAGMLIGVALHRAVRLRWLSDLRPYAASLVLLAAPAYIFALMWASGLFSAPWRGIEYARTNFSGVSGYLSIITTTPRRRRRCVAHSPALRCTCLWDSVTGCGRYGEDMRIRMASL